MPKYIKHKKTYKYSNEFKVKAVQLSHLDCVQVKDIAKHLTFIHLCCHAGVKNLEREI